MSEQVAKQFIDALWALENSKDAEPLAGLYTEGAAIDNILAPNRFQGPDGARKFWTDYRGTFEKAHSEFRTVTASETSAALEWTTSGTSFNGTPFSYTGVTILETDGEKVSRSSAYFDPSALGRQLGVK